MYPPWFIVVLSRLGIECLHCLDCACELLSDCPVTAPRLGESCDRVVYAYVCPEEACRWK